jgi:hypothetical protein
VAISSAGSVSPEKVEPDPAVIAPLVATLPCTSSVAVGALVLMPIMAVLPVPVWYTTESSIVEAPVKNAR